MRFKSPQANEIESLEKQKEEIDKKIALVRKVPSVWLEDYFNHHPNIKINRIYQEPFLDSVLVEFIDRDKIFPFMLKDILVGINHIVSDLTVSSRGIILRFSKPDKLIQHG